MISSDYLIVVGNTPSKAKTETSESVGGLLKPESAKATTVQLSIGDGGASEQNLDQDDMEKDLQEEGGLSSFLYTISFSWGYRSPKPLTCRLGRGIL